MMNMANENIMFEHAGYVKAKIDDEELNLEVKRIQKQPTEIILNQENIDITLGDNIEFSGIIKTIEEMQDILNSGLLYVTIQDNNSNDLILTTITFEDKKFEASIPNSLPSGDYYCKIDYLESKYFLAYHYIIKFKINKRAIGYKFDKMSYMGYPNQQIDVQLYLYDYKTKKPVESTVVYRFNGEEFLGRTDKYGYLTMGITIPEVIKENCKSFMEEEMSDLAEETDEDGYLFDIDKIRSSLDTKGWVYQNGQLIQWFDSAYHYYVGELDIDAIERGEGEKTSDINEERYYTLEIEIINDKYITYPISLKIHVMKSPTTIIIEEKNKINNKTRIIGHVDGAVGRVKYGAIILEVQNELEKIKFYIDEYGNFDYYYDPIEAAKNSSNNLENHIPEKGNTRKINVMLDFEVDKSEIINTIVDGEYGKTYVYDVYDDTQLYATVKVSAIKNNEVVPVKEGMICFIIYRQRYDGVWVRNYRYSEEITDDGEAEILFELTKEGKYYIYAEYYGMFEYNDAKSKKQHYQVINDATSIKFNAKDALQLDMNWKCYISITDDERDNNDRRLLIDNISVEPSIIAPQDVSLGPLRINDNIEVSKLHKDIRMKKIRLEEPNIEITQEIERKDNG